MVEGGEGLRRGIARAQDRQRGVAGHQLESEEGQSGCDPQHQYAAEQPGTGMATQTPQPLAAQSHRRQGALIHFFTQVS